MTHEELLAEAQALARARESSRYNELDVTGWLDEAQRSLVAKTDCLQGGSNLTTVSTGVTGTTVQVVSVKHMRVGHKLDFILAGTREESNCKIASIDPSLSPPTVTLTASVTVSTAAQVWWRNDYGFETTVAAQDEYWTPYSCLKLLRVSLKDGSGDQYRPLARATDAQLAGARRRLWPFDPATPGANRARMFWMKGNLKTCLYPAPGVGATDGLWFEYARRPLPLALPSDEPDVDENYHKALAHYAAAKMLVLDESPQEAAMMLSIFNDALDEASRFVGSNTPQPIARSQE